MKHVLVLILSVGISALIGGIVYNAIPKTAFVDNQRLFQEFGGKKELEQRLEQAAHAQQAALDSLGLQIKSLQVAAQQDEQAAKRMFLLQRNYQQQEQEQQMDYQQKSQEYTEAIWKQISQYTIEYGESQGYDYVFGIAGQGTLMYGKEGYDITEEVLTYINAKYEGN